MTNSPSELSPERQVQEARKAFDHDIERFVRFCDPAHLSQIDLETASAEERAFAEVRARHLGKKSALAASKKLIGRVAPEMRPVFGQVVRSRRARLLAGAGYVAVLLGMVLLVDWLDRVIPDPMPVWLVVLIGGLGGWISAFGGAWKDAPKEGFQIFKFFRSPIIASLFALGLSYLSHDLVLVTLAATGFCVATTETYKTFFFPSVPRGKFAGMPVHFPDMLRKRQPFIFLYAGIWVVVLTALVVALKGVPALA